MSKPKQKPKKPKNSIILYFEQYESIKELSLEDKGRILDAVFTYAMTGNIPEGMPPLVSMAFSFIRTAMNIDSEKYKEKCQQNTESINKRWNKSGNKDTNVYECIGANTNDTDTDTDTDTNTVTESESDIIARSPDFSKFLLFLKDKAPYCYENMTLPSEKQFTKLKEKYTGNEISAVIEKIENRTDLRENYSNLYITLCSWLKNEYPGSGTNAITW